MFNQSRNSSQTHSTQSKYKVYSKSNEFHFLSLFSELVNCKNVDCPPMNHIECPADSSVHIIHPNHINNIHSTININKHAPTVSFDSTDPIFLTDRYLLHKRSINIQSQDDAGRLPSAERHARQFTDTYDDESNTDVIKTNCCPQKICKCKPCAIPTCLEGEIIQDNVHGNQWPGNCCPTLKCVKQNFCINDFGMQLSNGSSWKRDDCTTCKCEDGDIRCFASACRALSCKKTVKLDNECCPKCDLTDSEFCVGFEACDIACQFDYVKTDAGCKLCKCARLTTNIPTTEPTTEIPLTSEATTTEIIDNIIFNKTKKEAFFSITLIALVTFACVMFALVIWLICLYTKKNVYRNVPLSDPKRSKIKEIECTACLSL